MRRHFGNRRSATFTFYAITLAGDRGMFQTETESSPTTSLAPGPLAGPDEAKL